MDCARVHVLSRVVTKKGALLFFAFFALLTFPPQRLGALPNSFRRKRLYRKSHAILCACAPPPKTTFSHPYRTQSQSHFPPDFDLDNLNPRLDASVESDIVGYTTITTTPGFNMVGVVFNGLDGKEVPLSEIVNGDFQDGDEIQVYKKGGGYVAYTYWKDFGGWLDGNFEAAREALPLGTAFWQKTPGRSIPVTLKGAVATGEYKYESVAGLQMIALGIPKAFDLNDDLVWSGLTDGDEIQIRDGSSYVSYTYWKDFGGWLDGNFNKADKSVPVGASLWLKTSNAGTIVVARGVTR